MMCDEPDDHLVEVRVELDYMAQNFHKMVNFKVKTSAENEIVKKISFRIKINSTKIYLLKMGYKT